MSRGSRYAVPVAIVLVAAAFGFLVTVLPAAEALTPHAPIVIPPVWTDGPSDHFEDTLRDDFPRYRYE